MFEGGALNNGKVVAGMFTRNYLTSDSAFSNWRGIQITLDKSDNVTWAVAGSAAFRTAISAKGTQTAKSDPTASGTSVTFIDTISQDAQGVITATKKTVRTFVKSGSDAASGLVPAPSTTAGTTKFLREDATWQTALTSHQDISGKKNTQSAVSDPSASGTSVTFIATISQNAQGVISPTKKTVRTFTKSGSDAATGLVPAPSTTAGTTKFLCEDATWKTALTSHQDISGKKNTQTAKSDPSASGTSTSFIATISQNAQGVITATKKNVVESFSIPASGSKTFNVGNSFRGIIFVVGGSTDSQDVIVVYSTSAGAIAYSRALGGQQLSSAITVTTGTGTIKLANSKTYALNSYVMVFGGSVS